MANPRVDAPGATSPNTVNNRLGKGAKENYTEYEIRNDKGSIALGSIDKQAACLLYTSPSPRDATLSRMPSSA